MKKKKNKQNGSTFISSCSSDNIIQVDDRVNHFSWTEYHGRLPAAEPSKKALNTH